MKRGYFSWASWGLAALALFVLVYGAALFVFALRHPSDGLGGILTAEGFLVSKVPQGSAVRANDVVVAVNGRPISQGLNAPGAWHAFLFAGSPSAATYTVLREGGLVKEARVPLRRWAPLDMVWRVIVPLVIALSFCTVALLILFSHNADAASHVIASVFCVQGLNITNDMLTALGCNLTLDRAWLFGPINLLTFSLGSSLFLHALLSFPQRKWLIRRFPLGMLLIHLCNFTVALLAMAGVGPGSVLHNRGMIFGRVLYPLAAVEMLFGMGSVLHTYFTTHRHGVRNQIRWLVWGTVLGPLPWLLLYNLPIVLTGQPLIPLSLTSLFLILIPIAFFFSVTRRGLTVVDTLIHSSLVYTALTVLLTLVYLGAVSALESMLAALVGIEGPRAASILAIMVVALAANPLRERFQIWVDQAFYRHWLDLKALLREVGPRLSTTLQLEAMVPILVREIPERLSIAQATLLLRQEEGTFVAVDASELRFPPDHPLVARLTLRNAPVVLSQFRQGQGAWSDLAAKGWEVVLPLRSGRQLLGLYILGPRLNGDLYGQDELETLTLLAQQIAITLENAQLYRQVETYSQGLEVLVQERTRELESTNRELSRERDRLDVIIQNMADGLVVVSDAGHVMLANPAFAKMASTSPDDLLGVDIGAAMDCERLREAIQSAFASPGRLFTVDCNSADPRGDARVVRATCVALHDGSGSISVLRDITHEMAVDRMKTEFISTVSHELRTPLTSVLGFAKLIHKFLNRDVTPVIPAESRRAQRAMGRVLENLDIIIVEGERLTRLINDVLDIAKMESGKMEWHESSFDLAEVVQQAIHGVQALIKEQGLDMRVSLEDDVPEVRADRDRIHQVVTNLLSNAVKFTPEGHVAVRLRRLAPSEMVQRWSYLPDNPGGVLLSVRDTGVGIPESELPNLFQRFKQVREDSLTDKPKGTGLGLAICREIITHYGGLIWAESVLGEGSNFQFVLPLPAASIDAVVKPSLPIIGEIERRVRDRFVTQRPSSVLVVDDEPSIRTLLAQELRDAGYRVLEASNGVDALTIARRHRPSLILLDVMMPGISGFDVTQILKHDPDTASIPILILSIVEDREYGLALGADAYLTKPVEIAVLLETMSSLVSAGAGHAPRATVAGTDGSRLSSVTAMLHERGFEVTEAHDPGAAIAAVQETLPDVVILDEGLSKFNDAQVIRALRFQEASRSPAIIVLTEAD